jgi:hypothetical protein
MNTIAATVASTRPVLARMCGETHGANSAVSLTTPRQSAVGGVLREFPGAADLRAQAETAMVVGGALVLDLAVDRSLPCAAVDKRVPVQAAVDGEGYDGGLILSVDEGRLSGLEYWWVTEEAPTGFPPVSAISAPVVTR